MWRQELEQQQGRQERLRGRQAGESGLADAGKPKRGGKLIYGLEAETGGGYCLAEGQLAISGIMVARAFYDTLTVPNDKGEYVPYLAKTVTPTAPTTRRGRSRCAAASSSTTAARSPRRSSRTTSTPTAASIPAAARCCSCSCSTTSPRSRRQGPLTVDGEDDQAVGGVPGLPLQLRPARDHGPGPTGRQEDLRPQAHRHRPVHVRQLAGRHRRSRATPTPTTGRTLPTASPSPTSDSSSSGRSPRALSGSTPCRAAPST